MTLRANDLGMFSGQLESYQTVIKCVTICVDPIMAVQTVAPERKNMVGCEDRIDLGVAILANSNGKC